MSVAGVVAMVMAVLAVCPCPPVLAAATEDGHGCCAGKPGFNAAPAAPSCCLDESRDPQLADARVSAAPADGWPTLEAVIVTLPAPVMIPAAIAAARPPSAPPVLRI